MKRIVKCYGLWAVCALAIVVCDLGFPLQAQAESVFSPTRGRFYGGMFRHPFTVQCNNVPIQLVGLSEEPVRGYGHMGWITWIQASGCNGEWVGGRYGYDLERVLGQLRQMGYGTMNIGVSRLGFVIEGAQMARVEPPAPPPVYRVPPRETQREEPRERSNESQRPAEKTTTAWMTASDRSSPVIQVTEGTIHVGMYASGDCASVEGVRLEGDGGVYAFTSGGQYEVSPGRYSVMAAGRVTAGGDICRNGRVTCTIVYR